MGPIDNVALSSLIGDIYECALDRTRWEPTLERISHTVDQGCSTLSTDAPLQKGIKALQSRGVSVLTEGTSAARWKWRLRIGG